MKDEDKALHAKMSDEELTLLCRAAKMGDRIALSCIIDQVNYLRSARAEATLAEREACCDEVWRVCDIIGAKPWSSIHSAFKHAEAAIRARSTP